MAYASKIHKQARDEYMSAYEWYEFEQEGLGGKFMNAVEKRFMQIRENPEYYSRVYGSYRQANIEGFPFSIVYIFSPKRKFVHISSIYHSSRNPKNKFRKEE